MVTAGFTCAPETCPSAAATIRSASPNASATASESYGGAAASARLAAECGARYVHEDPVGAAYEIAAAETLQLQSDTGN